MIVVEAGHAHVMKFFSLVCKLSIFVTVTVIFYVKSALMRILLIEPKNIVLFCNL
jgi:hypothetical protein